MKETYYFSHDYNARSDEKIIKLISKTGWEGYGLYWAIIEKLYEANGFLKKDYECIAFDLRTQCERIKEVIESGLFLFCNDKFYSKSVNARLSHRKGKSETARQSAFIRWNKPKKGVCERNANAMRTQCYKGKERKGKESKVKYIQFIYNFYQLKINKLSKLTDQAKLKIKARLKVYSVEELKSAIDKFSQDKWWMENNSHRGVAWFFHSDDRIDQFINLKELTQTEKEKKRADELIKEKGEEQASFAFRKEFGDEAIIKFKTLFKGFY